MHKLQKEVACLQSAFVSVSGLLSQITQQLTELKCSFQSFTEPVLSVSPRLQDCKDASLPSSPATVPAQPASHASVVTSAITVSVKKAVADSIKDRNSMSRDKLSVMIYGLPESKQDSQDITEVLKTISVTWEPIAWFRLGKLINDGSFDRPRPLRLIFSKPSNKYSVLSVAKNLKGNIAFGKVCISRFLSSDELSQLKQTRVQCMQLNYKSGSDDKRFVIGKIMTRGSNGKLKPYSQSTMIDGCGKQGSAACSEGVSLPKNV